MTAEDISKVVLMLHNNPHLRRATIFVSPKETVKATRQRRFDRRSNATTVILTYGKLNYADRKYLKRYKTVPKNHMRLTAWPKKRAK